MSGPSVRLPLAERRKVDDEGKSEDGSEGKRIDFPGLAIRVG